MTEEKDKQIKGISIEAQELYRKLETIHKGDFVSYDDLNIIAMGDVQNEKRFALNTARKNCLRSLRLVFGCVTNKGLKCLSDSEKIIVSSKTRDHIGRQAHKSLKILASVEFEQLSNPDKIKHNAEMSVAGVLRHMTKPRQIKQIEAKVSEAGQRLQLKDTLRVFEEKQKLEIVRNVEEKKV